MTSPPAEGQPAALRPAVTIALIFVCAALYVWQHIVLTGPEGRELELAWGLVPDSFAQNPATLVSSMFLHLGLLHLAGNVLFLWVFGKDVEDAMGHARFLAFYLLCGVLGAYLLLFPGARVLLVLPLGFVNVHFGRFPAVWVLAVWFGLQILLGAILDDTSGGVLLGAVFAHVVGFVVGLALVTFFKRRGVSLWRRY